LLGPEFEVHGGGTDLVFPHHENEAAQTLAARGHPLARIWMHNGMLQLAASEEKMSKSVGNIEGLAEVLDDAGRDALVLYFSQGHYRQPIAFSRERLEDAARGVARIREAGRRLLPGPSPEDLAPLRERFFDALAEDFNTARALAVVFEWVAEANRRDGVGDADLREMLGVLGLDNLLEAPAEEAPPDVLALVAARTAAREARDWAEADRLRDEARSSGWEIRDGPEGPELVPLA
jgi:cysteinyl-tRNA synthetase